MGEVYKAWDMRRNVYLAMKVLRTDLYEDPAALKRFQREADALSRLAHPNIVPFYGLFEEDGLHFLLEKFVDGYSLADVLKGRKGTPLPLGEALIYLKSLCSALGYSHSHDVVHCDVKPGNVMIDSGGSIFLTDFGIARYASGGTTSTLGPAGTPAYMSPEQIRGEPLTPAGDIYAIGLILFEMVVGRRPFRGDDSAQNTPGMTPSERIRIAHLTQTPPDPCSLRADLPRALGQVILRALAKDPADRFASAMELYNAAAASAGFNPAQVPDRVIETRPAQPELVRPEHSPLPELVRPEQSTLPEPVKVRAAAGADAPGVPRPASWLKTKRHSLLSYLAIGGLFGLLVVAGVGFLGLRWLINWRGSLAAAATAAPPAATEAAALVEASATERPAVPAATLTVASPGEPTATLMSNPTPALPPTMTVALDKPTSDKSSAVGMVEVPAGEFVMGSDTSPWEFERPMHSVSLDAFLIEKTEVTNAMFAEFVNATGYVTQAEKAGAGFVYAGDFQWVQGANWRRPNGPDSSLAGRELFPVVQVSWTDAQAYCAWADRRLPTEAEWEKAARGSDGREYPWGNEISCSQANYKDCVGDAVGVGSYPEGASPYGALDMAGNVWEWVADFYSATYYPISPLENPTGPNSETERVHRGGSWYDLPAHVRAAYRYGNPPERTFNAVGFRCAGDP